MTKKTSSLRLPIIGADDRGQACPEQIRQCAEFASVEFLRQAAFVRDRFNITDYDPAFSVTFAPRNCTSYGGTLIDDSPFVHLSLGHIAYAVGTDIEYLYEEYNHIGKDPVIGDGTGSWKANVAWLIAHEVAHTILEVPELREQVKVLFDPVITKDISGHGLYWQEVYRIIRGEACKHDREEFSVDSEDFSETIYHTTVKKDKVSYIVIHRGLENIAYYLREAGTLYKTNKNFNRRNKCKFKNVREIKRFLQG